MVKNNKTTKRTRDVVAASGAAIDEEMQEADESIDEQEATLEAPAVNGAKASKNSKKQAKRAANGETARQPKAKVTKKQVQEDAITAAIESDKENTDDDDDDDDIAVDGKRFKNG